MDDLFEALAQRMPVGGSFERITQREESHRLEMIGEAEMTADDVGIEVAHPAGGKSERCCSETELSHGYRNIHVGVVFAVGRTMPCLGVVAAGYNTDRG